ncbi:MAG: Xaa-Pro peptidase family protein [Candidatus Peribacteraceae bacterium]
MPQKHYTLHLQRLKALMRKVALPALLITNLTNIRYLTGLTVSAGSILIANDEATLFVDGRYSEAATTVTWMKVKRHRDLLTDLSRIRRLGIEESVMTVAEHQRLHTKLKSTKLVQTKSMIEGLRMIKDQKEIKSVQAALRITKSILRSIPAWLRASISERDLAFRIEREALALGAETMAFPTIVGFGSNTSLPHHHPTDRPLRKTDIVQIDLGVKVDGYCSDMSRVFFIGTPTTEMKKVYRALKKAKKSAECLVHPGVSTRRLDRVARDSLKVENLEQYFVHSLGHGVGLDIHESPTLSSKAPDHRLRAGEIITIEPGVYIPGKWGMRIEDTIIVTV